MGITGGVMAFLDDPAFDVWRRLGAGKEQQNGDIFHGFISLSVNEERAISHKPHILIIPLWVVVSSDIF